MAQLGTKPQVKRPAPQNFLEALRDLGQDMASETKIQVKQVFTQDIPESFGLPISGTLSPHESVSLNFPQSPEKKHPDSDMILSSRLQQLREEEHAMMTREQSAIKEQIRSIQEELRSLAKSSGQLSQEIETATFQAAVNPGLYHKNFFSHLKSILTTLRKQVADSRNWLAEFNGRSAKQGHYWGQVSKSGTKYMLSSERYMVMSTG